MIKYLESNALTGSFLQIWSLLLNLFIYFINCSFIQTEQLHVISVNGKTSSNLMPRHVRAATSLESQGSEVNTLLGADFCEFINS